jgi:formamidopyrimidine-DNA glycosylase
MPEAPEVRCIADRLQCLVNCNIVNIQLFPTSNFFSQLSITLPITVTCVRSYGKKLFIVTDQQIFMFSLGMTGRFLLLDDKQELPKHSKCVLLLSNNHRLVFEDSRNFGRINNLVHNSTISLGPDVLQLCLQKQFTYQLVYNCLSNKPKLQIATALLDQELLAGIGNYLRSEILYYAAINPHRKIATFSLQDWSNLTDAINFVMVNAYTNNGLTIRDYISPDGSLGTYNCAVYNKTHDMYGNTVIKEKFQGRSIFYVDSLQR